MTVQTGFSTRTKRLISHYIKDPSERDSTVKKVAYKGDYSKISIWNGLTRARSLTHQLIAATFAIANRRHVGGLDLDNASRDFAFPNGTIVAIR
jgi:hypothetical protein